MSHLQTPTLRRISSVNEEIDKLRLSATAALIERRDVIVIASVSCIYGLGEPENFEQMMVSLRPGMEKDRDEVLRQLIDIQYDRNDMDFKRGTFRVRGRYCRSCTGRPGRYGYPGGIFRR